MICPHRGILGSEVPRRVMQGAHTGVPWMVCGDAGTSCAGTHMLAAHFAFAKQRQMTHRIMGSNSEMSGSIVA